MQAKTEQFLYYLLWGAETLMAPTFRNVTGSYEGWAYRKGLHRHLARLEGRKLITRKSGTTTERIYRLTETGRLLALGGADPPARWNRRWDGRWRVVAFDLPEKHNKARVRLRRLLKERRFGYLQNSFWITPDPLDEDLKKLAAKGHDVESFLTLEAQPCSGESDQAIVAGAWDFERINRLYEHALVWLKQDPKGYRGRRFQITHVEQWGREEHRRWDAAVRADPLLPEALLPRGYRGTEAWKLRNTVFRRAGQWLTET